MFQKRNTKNELFTIGSKICHFWLNCRILKPYVHRLYHINAYNFGVHIPNNIKSAQKELTL